MAGVDGKRLLGSRGVYLSISTERAGVPAGIYGKLPHGTFHRQNESMLGRWDTKHARGPLLEN